MAGFLVVTMVVAAGENPVPEMHWNDIPTKELDRPDISGSAPAVQKPPFGLTDLMSYNLSYFYDTIEYNAESTRLVVGQRVREEKVPENIRIHGKKPDDPSWLMVEGQIAMWVSGVPAPEEGKTILLAARPIRTGEAYVIEGLGILMDVLCKDARIEARVGAYLYIGLPGSKSNSCPVEVDGEAVETLYYDPHAALILRAVRPGIARIGISSLWWTEDAPKPISSCEIEVQPADGLEKQMNKGAGPDHGAGSTR
jgi:hypothetical protein